MFTDTSILIDYQDNWNRIDPPVRQTITFESCIFEDLPHGENQILFQGNYRDFSTFIRATLPANSVVIRDSVFRNINQQEGGVSGILACGRVFAMVLWLDTNVCLYPFFSVVPRFCDFL